MIQNIVPTKVVQLTGDRRTYCEGREDYRKSIIKLVEDMTEKSINMCGESKESNIEAVGYIKAVEEITDFLEEHK